MGPCGVLTRGPTAQYLRKYTVGRRVYARAKLVNGRPPNPSSAIHMAYMSFHFGNTTKKKKTNRKNYSNNVAVNELKK